MNRKVYKNWKFIENNEFHIEHNQSDLFHCKFILSNFKFIFLIAIYHLNYHYDN